MKNRVIINFTVAASSSYGYVNLNLEGYQLRRGLVVTNGIEENHSREIVYDRSQWRVYYKTDAGYVLLKEFSNEVQTVAHYVNRLRKAWKTEFAAFLAKAKQSTPYHIRPESESLTPLGALRPLPRAAKPVTLKTGYAALRALLKEIDTALQNTTHGSAKETDTYHRFKIGRMTYKVKDCYNSLTSLRKKLLESRTCLRDKALIHKPVASPKTQPVPQATIVTQQVCAPSAPASKPAPTLALTPSLQAIIRRRKRLLAAASRGDELQTRAMLELTRAGLIINTGNKASITSRGHGLLKSKY